MTGTVLFSTDVRSDGVPMTASNASNIPLLASIFVLVTVLSWGGYWWLDKRAHGLPGVLRDSYKLGLIIVYGLQVALLLMFAL